MSLYHSIKADAPLPLVPKGPWRSPLSLLKALSLITLRCGRYRLSVHSFTCTLTSGMDYYRHASLLYNIVLLGTILG